MSLADKEAPKYTTFITVGNRHTINDTIGNCLMSALGSTSQEAIDAFNDAFGEVDRSIFSDDYEFMCAVMANARAKMDKSA